VYQFHRYLKSSNYRKWGYVYFLFIYLHITIVQLFGFGGSKKTHPTEIADSPDFSLRPILDASFGLHGLDLLETIGTGSFGRVRLVRHIENKGFYALKIMKKAKIVRLNQVINIQFCIWQILFFRSWIMLKMKSKYCHMFVVSKLSPCNIHSFTISWY
jgi:hypothetical protein